MDKQTGIWLWDATNKKWVKAAGTSAGALSIHAIVEKLDDIEDVDVATPTDQHIIYRDDAAGKWKAKAIWTAAHKDTHDPIDGSDKLDTAAPVKVGEANAIGSSHSYPRADHVHEKHHAKYTNAEAVAAAKTVKLDDFTAPDDNTDLDASAAKHGLMSKVDANKADGISAGHEALTTGIHGVGTGHIVKSLISGVREAFLFDRLMYHEDWKSLDKWTYVADGSSTHDHKILQSYLKTGVTINSKPYIHCDANFYHPHRAGHHSIVNASARYSLADVNHWLYLVQTDEGLPPSDTCDHAGFKIIDGRVWATNADGTTETATDTGFDVTVDEFHYFEMIGDGSSIKYYIDDVLKATHTTNLPSSWNYKFCFVIENTAAANKGLWTQFINLTQ